MKNVKLTSPWELELTSSNQVSWNSAETTNPCKGISPLLDSTIRAVKVTLEPRSTTVLIIGDLSINVVTPLTKIIGYDLASKVALNAYNKNISLKESCLELTSLSESDFDKYTNPKNMV